MILSWATVTYGAAPTIEVRWTPDGATLSVHAPADQKIAADAPSTLSFGIPDATWSVETFGAAALNAPVTPRGHRISGVVALAVCNLDGTECRPGRWTYSGEIPDRGRGRTSFVGHVGGEESFGADATADSADAAFARARGNGRAVLLDFSAVWCPPCNLLAAEVLHGDPVPELDAYEVVVLDVDHPSSFALKDRYNVGGYPTLVVTDPEGNERARHLGYTTRDELVGWLAAAAQSTEAADLAREPGTVSPARAAELGLLLAERGDTDEAKVWLARAEEEPGADGAATHLLRFLVAPTPAELAWLVTHAPERTSTFAAAAVDLGGPDAHRAVALELRAAQGPALAVALDHAARLAPPAERAVLYASAAAVMRNELTGDRAHDKGYITDLAWLMVQAGDGDGAVALLEAWAASSPGDPTFDLSLASRLLELEQYDAALVAADRALAVAWGDNALRSAAAKSRALMLLGRVDEAKAVAAQALEAQPAPSADVRTHQYRKTLETLAAGG